METEVPPEIAAYFREHVARHKIITATLRCAPITPVKLQSGNDMQDVWDILASFGHAMVDSQMGMDEIWYARSEIIRCIRGVTDLADGGWSPAMLAELVVYMWMEDTWVYDPQE